jgi:hypothetical protein
MTSDENILAFLRTDKGMKKAANAIYSTTHRDFRGRFEDKTRNVLQQEPGLGTCLVPLDGVKEERMVVLLKTRRSALKKLGLITECE